MNATSSNEATKFFASMYAGSDRQYVARLVAAEQWKDIGVENDTVRVRWEADDDCLNGWDDDDDPETARKISAGLIEFFGCIVETKCEKCGQWEHAESLWGIGLDNSTDETRRDSRNYQRLVEAELCLEAMPD